MILYIHMPYFLKEVKDGYKVCKTFEPNKCFSNKPLTEDKAKKQMKAIGMNENKKIWKKVKKGMGKYKKGFFFNNVLKEDNIDAFDPITKRWISINDVLKGGIDPIEEKDSDDSDSESSISVATVRSDIEDLLFEDLTAGPINKIHDDEEDDDDDYIFNNPQPAQPIQGQGKSNFNNQLNKIGFDPALYLKIARETGKENGYNPNDIEFSNNPKSKLMIKDGDKHIHFGRVGYNDFIIWRYLEVKNKIKNGEAEKKQRAYLARANKIKGDWKNDKFSKNNLAIKILWN